MCVLSDSKIVWYVHIFIYQYTLCMQSCTYILTPSHGYKKMQCPIITNIYRWFLHTNIYICLRHICVYIYIYGDWLSTVGANFNARPRRLRHFMAKPKKWQLNSYLPIPWPKIIIPSLDQGQWPNRPRCSTKPCNRQDLGDGFQQESRWENCD